MQDPVMKDWIEKIAELARLELSPEELRSYEIQLSQILEHVRTLESVHVDEVKPLIHPIEFLDSMRDDQLHSFPRTNEGLSAVMDSAPELVHQGFKVPAILS